MIITKWSFYFILLFYFTIHLHLNILLQDHLQLSQGNWNFNFFVGYFAPNERTLWVYVCMNVCVGMCVYTNVPSSVQIVNDFWLISYTFQVILFSLIRM